MTLMDERPNPWSRRVAVTGAGGALGSALRKGLQRRGATVIGISRSPAPRNGDGPRQDWLVWNGSVDAALEALLLTVDILVINHGVNPLGRRDPQAIAETLQANLVSAQALIHLFFRQTHQLPDRRRAYRELWVNTSEAEVGPAFSPVYEVSKRSLGALLTLQTLDAPCTVRRLILGAFRSGLNPYGPMSAGFVAERILDLAAWNLRLIIVSFNPCTYLLAPLAMGMDALYGRICTRPTPINSQVRDRFNGDP
ncbi:MAG: NAD-dependent epimerase/dehydratase family protein [Cyanobacteria bacterium MAG CAR1_bin_15]|nr:NAD-dependent epimerase/dehydratase family protein [Cyanobacteria bacterium MAG CAR1_bin_15]